MHGDQKASIQATKISIRIRVTPVLFNMSIPAESLVVRDAGADDSTASRLLRDVPTVSKHPFTEHRFVDVTLLFSDIQDSVELVDRLGDVQSHCLFRVHDAIVRGVARGHIGRVIDSAGDGFFLGFESATRGLRCAIDIQRALERSRAGLRDQSIRVRIGLHCGRAIEEDGRYFGKSVMVAARLASHARGGEVLVSECLRNQLPSSGEFSFDSARHLCLKGLPGLHRAYSALW